MARVALLGNFRHPFCSEVHEAASIESLGHHVCRIQEGETRATDVPRIVHESDADVFWWVQTLPLAEQGGSKEERLQMVLDIKQLGVPTVAFHLDLWWSLDRQIQILTEPYFSCDHVFTADGGHDELWIEAGVNHHWLPPAVFHEEAYDALPNPSKYNVDVAFVGSWRRYGHAEHAPVRQAMLRVLSRKYGRRFKCWPVREAVRGNDLNELYASVPVIVGDSCLAGKVDRYWSDRVPETTGRGGFIIHPYVSGILNVHPDLITFPPGQWDEMIAKVDHALANTSDRELNRKMNAEWTRAHHTYRHRVQEVFRIVGVT